MEKGFNVETVKIYKGYKIYVVKITYEVPLFWYDMTDNRTYFNGYIVLPENSKFYGKEYNFINEEIEVHGGFTFADFVENEYEIGFDTAHYFDNITTQNVDFVLEQLKQAVDQIIESENKKGARNERN